MDATKSLTNPSRSDVDDVNYPSSPKSVGSNRRRRYKNRNSVTKNDKVKMCRNYLRGIPCPFESRCAFSHGPSSTQTQSREADSPRSPKWRRFNTRYSAFDGEEDYDGALTEDIDEEDEENDIEEEKIQKQDISKVAEDIAVQEQESHLVDDVNEYYQQEYMNQYSVQMQYYPEEYYYYAQQHGYYPYSYCSEMYEHELVGGEVVVAEDDALMSLPPPPPSPPPPPPPPPAYEEALQEDAEQQMITMMSMMMTTNESDAVDDISADATSGVENNTPSVTVDDTDEYIHYEHELPLQYAPPAYPTRYRHDPYSYEGYCFVY